MSSKNPNDLPQENKGLFPSNGAKNERFIQTLNQAMVMNCISRRELGDKLGVPVATVFKYLDSDGLIDPFNVKARVAINLAGLLGVTIETLYKFYDTGELGGIHPVSIEDVERWIIGTGE